MTALVAADAGPNRPARRGDPARRGPELALVGLLLIGMVGSTFGVTIGGVRLSPYRVAGLAVAVWAVLVGPARLQSLGRRTTVLVAIAAAWTAWAVISLTWTPSLKSGVVDVFALLGGVGTLIAVVWLVERAGGVRWLLIGWWLSALVASTIAAVEIVTGLHLPSDFLPLRPGFTGRYLTSTFGNPNDFAAFVLVAIPFTMALARTTLDDRRRVVLWASTALFAVMVVVSQSRLCSVGLVVIAGVEVVVRLRHPVRAVPALAIAAFGLVALIAVAPPIRDKFALIPHEIQDGGSSRDRYLLAREGVVLTGAADLIGVGAGGFAPIVAARPAQLTNSGDVNPHAFPIEVLAQYGLLVFLAVAGWWVWAVRSAGRLRRRARVRGDREAQVLAIASTSGAVALLLASLDPSSFVTSPTGWLAIATIAALLRRATIRVMS